METLKLKMLFAAAMLLTVSACSSTSSVAPSASKADIREEQTEIAQNEEAEEDKLICYQEKAIGSNRKSTRCMKKSDRDKMREVSREAWLRSQQGSETGGGPI